MFTGIIQKIGRVINLEKKSGNLELSIQVRKPWPNRFKIGESIAVDGVCLTVVRSARNSFFVQAVPETLSLTALNHLSAGSSVNLERSLKLNDFIGGHFVFGHVDTTGKIIRKLKRGKSHLMKITVPPAVRRYLILKGSIAIDGISFTIQKLYSNSFEVAIVPHTADCTTIRGKKVGDAVNLEADMMAKKIYEYLNERQNRPKIRKS